MVRKHRVRISAVAGVVAVIVLVVIVWTTEARVVAWASTRWSDFWSLKPETQVSSLQLLALVVGGLWVFVLYHRRREGQATVRIAAAVRVAPSGEATGRTLFVRSHIANESAVVVRAVRSTVTLIDVQPATAANPVVMRRVAAQDILVLVNGELDVDKSGVLTFKPDKDPTLEPGECVESEVAFNTGVAPPGVVALRWEVEGEQGTFLPHWWGLPSFSGPESGKPWGIRFCEDFVWASFVMVDPATMPNDYVMVSLHDRLAD
jgi:hypothetical protein